MVDDLEGSVVTVCEHPDLLADAESQARARDAHVLRVSWHDPDFERLRQDGFIVRPDWIMWVCQVPAGSDSFLAAQSRTQRGRTRLSMRALALYRKSVRDPVSAEEYDEWLELYSRQIAAMRKGVNIASQLRDVVLAPGSEHFLVTWHDDRGDMVGGMVGRRDHERSLLHVRFAAVRSPAPAPDLQRGMYAELADLARCYGLGTLSMGIDMNFYGAILNPGLCLYKRRLGAVPVAAGVLGEPDCGLVADKMLGVRGLEQPVLCFEQAPAQADGSPVETENGRLAAAASQLRLVAFVSGDFDQSSIPELGQMPVRLVG